MPINVLISKVSSIRQDNIFQPSCRSRVSWRTNGEFQYMLFLFLLKAFWRLFSVGLVFVAVVGGSHVLFGFENVVEMGKGKVAEAVGNFKSGKVGVFEKIAGVFYFGVAKKGYYGLSGVLFE